MIKKDHLVRHWYQIILALILLLPAVALPQILHYTSVRQLEDTLFKELLSFDVPRKLPASPIVVVDVDEASIKDLGWPIDREHYQTLLANLKKAGSPWVISLLQFQPLAKSAASPTIKTRLAKKDLALTNAIKDYQKWIGSSLEADPSGEVSIWAEENIMAKIAFNDGKTPVDMPSEGLSFLESNELLAAQRAVGMPTRFKGTNQVFCNQMYVTDGNYRESFVLPTSLALGAALYNQGSLVTPKGSRWPQGTRPSTTTSRNEIPLAYEHCVSSPTVDTAAFLYQRGIPRHSFHQFLINPPAESLADKIVVLTSSESRRFFGPGLSLEESLTNEHTLGIRFLDDLLTGRAIKRDHSFNRMPYPILTLTVGVTLFLCALIFPLNTLICVGLTMALTLVGAAAYELNVNQTYLIYMVPLLTCIVTSLALIVLKLFLVHHGNRNQLQFGELLREQFSRCNNLPELEKAVQHCCRYQFFKCSAAFIDYDKEFFAILESPDDVVSLLEKKGRQRFERVTDLYESIQTRIGRRPSSQRGAFSGRVLETLVSIEDHEKKLGNLKIKLTYLPQEIEFIGLLVDTLRHELGQHWSRIELLARQKYKDYEVVLEKTRSEIMSRFLADSVVDRFDDRRSMEDNFQQVLAPRTANAALIQADIRGYSSISAALQPMQMIRILKMYFSEVVDHAQKLAQIKLIGDCIFMFIEDTGVPEDGMTACDQAVFLARNLVKVTETQNKSLAKAGFPTLNFGIAINYGPVVIGNLSSDNCIDYTVIGDNVNKVARLEELTKADAVKRLLGDNGTILAPAVVEHLSSYRHLGIHRLNLKDHGLKVRSFEEIGSIHYVTAAELLNSHRGQYETRQEAG